jgi:outer membrane receptor protein involved in Fe transport
MNPLFTFFSRATAHRFAFIVVAGLSASQLAFGQVAPARSSAASGTGETEPHRLAAFEVVADPADAYEALNLSSLSGTNKSLEKLPISAEVINQTLIADLGTSDVKDLLNKYATGITPGQNAAGSPTAEGTGDGDRFTLFTLGIRGLNAGAARRNALINFGYLAEGFSMERMEIIRGPQALLYGTNPPGGIVNIMTKRAFFDRSFGSVQARFDDLGSRRFQLDANVAGQLLHRRAAVRAAVYDADIKYWREGIGRESHGLYLESAIELIPASQTILRFELENVLDTAIEPNQRRTVFGAAGVPNNTPLSLLLARQDSALDSIVYGNINWRTVDSLSGTAGATRRHQRYFGLTLTSKVGSWLDVKLVAATAPRWTRRIAAGSFLLAAPLTNGNPLSEWAVRMRPVIAPIVEFDNDALQAIFSTHFSTTDHARHNLVFGGSYTRSENVVDQYLHFEADANGRIIVNPNPALANTQFAGRTIIPLQWFSLRDGMPSAITLMQDRYVVDGRTYVLDRERNPNPAFATPTNPLGLNGGTAGSSWSEADGRGVFAALFTTWFGGRIESLAGVRYDKASSANYTIGTLVEGDDYSGNIGLVWNLTRPLALYAGYSRNFNPDSSGALLWTQEPLPNGIGKAQEAGVKLNAFEGRLSGSIAYYQAESVNEVERIGLATRQATDPSGINGNYYNFFLPSINYDRKSEGLEASLTARPMRNWRMQFGYSNISGKEGSSVTLPYLYNDEFRTDAQGRVVLANGSPLLVPVNPSTPIAADGRTYPPGVAVQAMTIDILRQGDANGNYRAQLSPDHGGIVNSGVLGLLVPDVGTGRVGLPISQHQLGFSPPTGSSIEARRGGDQTTGYPRHALTMTNMYSLSEGPLRGLGFGFNASLNWDTILYYYNDAAAGNERRAYKLPDRKIVNLIISYQRKLTDRVVWKTQINFNNVQDRRYLVVLPSLATGAPDNARYMANPSSWTWTNTFSF